MPQVIASSYANFGGIPRGGGLPRAYNLHGVTSDIGLFEAFCDDLLGGVMQGLTDSRVSKRLTQANGGQQVLKLYGPGARTCSRTGCEHGPSAGVKVCAGCMGNDDSSSQARYCSRECQKAHWPAHKLVCAGSRKPKAAHTPTSGEPDAKDSDMPVSTGPTSQVAAREQETAQRGCKGDGPLPANGDVD